MARQRVLKAPSAKWVKRCWFVGASHLKPQLCVEIIHLLRGAARVFPMQSSDTLDTRPVRWLQYIHHVAWGETWLRRSALWAIQLQLKSISCYFPHCDAADQNEKLMFIMVEFSVSVSLQWSDTCMNSTLSRTGRACTNPGKYKKREGAPQKGLKAWQLDQITF